MQYHSEGHWWAVHWVKWVAQHSWRWWRMMQPRPDFGQTPADRANVSYFPNPTVLPQLFQLRNLHRLEIFLSKWAKVPKVDDLPLIATWEWIHMTVASTTDIFAFLLNIVTCVTPAEHVLCKVISGANGTKNKTKIKMKINTRKTGSTQTCQGIIPLCLCLS